MRRTFRQAGLQGRVRLAFSECLGPCSEANVVFLYLHGRPLWFRRINSLEQLEGLLAYVHTAVEAPGAPMSEALTAHSFSCTAGAVGPELASGASPWTNP